MDILSGTINERRVVPVPKDSFVPLYPADSKTHPKWVQWHGFALQNEFYIAREDGKVIRLSLAQLKTPQVWEAGQLRFPVDKAFAALKLNSARNSPAHVFVAAGITSDGSVVKVEASAEGESETSEHIIPNWTPVHDMQVATNRMEDSTEPRQSLVIARGRAPFGEIAELRREIPVPIDGIGEGVKGCTDIWVVHYEAGPLDGEADGGKPPYAVLLLNLPLETLLLHVIRQDDTWNLANNGDPGAINLREETLAAGIVNGNFAIQINRSEAIIVRRPALTFVDSLKPTEKVFAASTEPGIPYFAIAYRCNDGLILEIVAISETGRLSSTIRIQLKDEPTCMQFITLNGNPHLFVGTFDGIHIFTMSSPAPLYTYSDPRIFENFALLEYGEDRVLLCGNRAGFLTSLNLVCGDSGMCLDFELWESVIQY